MLFFDEYFTKQLFLIEKGQFEVHVYNQEKL